MYPVTDVIFKSDECHDHKWVPKNEIGTDGTYEEVWSVCCENNIPFGDHSENNCNYALKYMPFDDGVRRNTK